MSFWVIGMWGLGSGAMLGWIAAAAIPLVIHLWSRRRYHEHPWGAMQFLLAALKKHSRRLRIEQLILLAIRMLLLALLGLALADPLWSWSTAGAAPDRPGATHYLLVVDTSFSMAYRDRDRTLLQAAQEQIHEFVQNCREGDGFTLILMEETPRAVLADIGFDPTEVLRQVDQIQVAHTGANLPAALASVERLLDEVQKRFPRIARHQICFFTDLRKNTWSEASLPSNRDLIERLARQAEISLFEVGSDDQSNLAVTSLSSSRTIATSGEALRFAAEVQGFGIRDPVATQVEFLIDGRVVQSSNVNVTGGERQTLAWDHRFESPGEKVVSVRVSSDSLPLDNERWLVAPVRKSLSVLCVGGEPEAAEFVALALNPEGSSDAPIQVTVAGESALLDQRLSDFDCVFLCNVGQYTSFEAAALNKYVVSGGGLVISLGDQVQADNYSRELNAGDALLLPAKIAEVEKSEAIFNPLEYRHPLVAPFRGRERAGLLTVPTWRYFRLVPNSSATIALAMSSGLPAVIESKVGLGRSVLVATALSPSSVDRSGESVTPWTALPAWPSFPPLVHGLLQMATQGRESARTIMVGSPLLVTLAASENEAYVIRPDGRRDRLMSDSASQQAAYLETSLCGVYEVELRADATQDRKYAANVNPRECDLQRVEESLLPPAIHIVRGADRVTIAEFPRGNQLQLFRPLLFIVLVLLLLEQALAVSFARRSM